ncbi:hypothetical protein [Undibacterium sp.]|uniref:hypothetical protein n=1 Tax=Undibacterium sp. TaxID=1914977 RepID=UPI00374DCCF0
MITLRQARLTDIPIIVEMAVESVSKDPLPVVINRDGMAATARLLIQGNQHFAMVAEVDGQVVAAVGALVEAGFWFERMQASVVMFSTRRANAGVALLRAFADWVKSRPGVKMAVFSLEANADPRIGKLLTRLGFGMQNPQYTYVRGLNVKSS